MKQINTVKNYEVSFINMRELLAEKLGVKANQVSFHMTVEHVGYGLPGSDDEGYAPVMKVSVEE
jgi:hypothetical protein